MKNKLKEDMTQILNKHIKKYFVGVAERLHFYIITVSIEKGNSIEYSTLTDILNNLSKYEVNDFEIIPTDNEYYSMNIVFIIKKDLEETK